MTEDEMVGWHHWLNGHEFEHTPGDAEGQGSLGYCSPWGHKELNMTEQLNNNNQDHAHITGNNKLINRLNKDPPPSVPYIYVNLIYDCQKEGKWWTFHVLEQLVYTHTHKLYF